MSNFIFINPIFVRHHDLKNLNAIQKKQLLNIFRKEALPEEIALAEVEKELEEFPCEFWQVIEKEKPEEILYDFLILYEDGRAFIANTNKLANIYVSQDTLQADDDPLLEEELQNAYDKRPKIKYSNS